MGDILGLDRVTREAEGKVMDCLGMGCVDLGEIRWQIHGCRQPCLRRRGVDGALRACGHGGHRRLDPSTRQTSRTLSAAIGIPP